MFITNVTENQFSIQAAECHSDRTGVLKIGRNGPTGGSRASNAISHKYGIHRVNHALACAQGLPTRAFQGCFVAGATFVENGMAERRGMASQQEWGASACYVSIISALPLPLQASAYSLSNKTVFRQALSRGSLLPELIGFSGGFVEVAYAGK